MIVSRTPLRISFFGGGTDFPQFFREEAGSVLSSAIDKYIYVIVKERFDDRIRLGYTRTELVDNVDELQHELVRECLRRSGLTRRIEVATMADIPSEGSGLGSSSTLTVGLLNSLYTVQGKARDVRSLAREACEIEVDVLEKPIGYQDQYAAACGGQQIINFQPNGSVELSPWPISPDALKSLEQRLLLFFTNVTRKAEELLSVQVTQMSRNMGTLRDIGLLAAEGTECLRRGALDDFGRLLHHGWELKKKLNVQISNGSIEGIYSAGREAGALGGKITGAGGGGFILFYCPISKQPGLRKALGGLRELPFQFEPGGTRIVFHC